MEIVNHLLYNQGKQVTYKQTPNHGGKIVPEYLIIHYDAANNDTAAINWMTMKKSGVSAHLHISKKGTIVQLAPFNVKCFHAGESIWNGRQYLNGFSIGIELQNNGTEDYTDIQLKVCLEVSKALVSHYKLKDVLGHEQISVGRKIDPGKKFPMKQFRKDSGIVTCEPIVTTVGLNLRSGAGSTYSILKVLPKGTVVDVLEELGAWSKVKVVNSNDEGYVSNQYLST